MLHEISRKIIKLSKYEETDIFWNNSALTVRGSKELHLLDFSYNLNSLIKGIDFKNCTVSCTKTSPISNDYLTKYVSRGVNNLELVEMVTNSAFWPHNKLLMGELTNIIAYHWSPLNLICENDSLLAVVNSVGNVEFFGPQRHSWCPVIDFSSQMSAYLTNIVDKLYITPHNFADVKEIVYAFETASVCWAPNLNEDNTCYFVTAQKSGNILFWLIKYSHNNFETELCGTTQSSNNVEIVHMLWITMEENKFCLVCSDEFGEMFLCECLITEKKVSLLNVHKVWSYKDKMITTYMYYYLCNDKLLLFFNKHRHLVIQMYDKNLKLISQNIQNVNDYKITSIAQFKEKFYLTTVNMKIFRIDYSITGESLQVSLEGIEFKEPGLSYELYGIAVSPNSALFALAMINRKLLLKKQTVSIEILLLSTDSECDTEVIKIINNPIKKMTHFWDIIELFRCKVMKAKKLPQLDYGLLLEDDSNMYNLKVYLIILKLYHNLEKSMACGLKGLLPETSIDVIKEKILMLQALAVIRNVSQSSSLSNFDYECFASSKNYLNFYCKRYDKKITDFVTEDVLNTHNVQFKYLCQWCDENLIDFSCKNKHVNMFCSHTLTPILSDYLVCKSCNSTVTSDLCNQNPTCIFCDLYLMNSDIVT